MKVILSPEFQKQYDIIRFIARRGNEDYLTLYSRINLVIQVINRINNLGEIPFKLRVHNGNVQNPGYLNGELSECMAIDLDKTNRFLVFQRYGDAIAITTLGHYNIPILKEGNDVKLWLFEKPEKQFGLLKYAPTETINSLKLDSDLMLIGMDDDEIPDSVIKKFDLAVENDTCPIDIETMKIRLHDVPNLNQIITVNQQSTENPIITLKPQYESLLKRATVNARYLSNIGVEATFDGDLLKAAQLNVALNKKMFKDFSNMIHYINTHVKYPREKKLLFDSMNDTFLSSYISCQEQVQSGIESLRQFDSILSNAVVNDLSRNNTDNETNKQAVVNLTKHQYLMKFRKLNEEQHYTQIFKNVAKEISERESKIESKRADEIKSPKKGFHL